MKQQTINQFFVPTNNTAVPRTNVSAKCIPLCLILMPKAFFKKKPMPKASKVEKNRINTVKSPPKISAWKRKARPNKWSRASSSLFKCMPNNKSLIL